MSVPAANNHVTYTGNGVTTTFAYTFNIKNSSSAKAIRYDTVANTETVLVVDVDFSVSAYNADVGGTVTYPISGTILPATQTITIYNDPPIAQTYEPDAQNGFSPATMEDQFDRIVMMIQEHDRVLAKALIVPQGEASTPAALMTALINYLESATTTLAALGTLTPSIHNTYDIGAAAIRWRNGFFQTNVRVAAATDVNSDDVVTRGATQTLTAKTLTSPAVNGTMTHTTGFVRNWNASDVTETHAANVLTWAGATSGYTFNDGAVILGAGQLSFPAVQNASSGANVFDDYEEGSWTPIIVGTSTAGAGTYSTQAGQYTKKAIEVGIGCQAVWTAHTGIGNMTMTGGPFSSASTTGLSIAYSDLTYTSTPQARSNGSGFSLMIAASGVAASNIPLDAVATIYLGGVYTV